MLSKSIQAINMPSLLLKKKKRSKKDICSNNCHSSEYNKENKIKFEKKGDKKGFGGKSPKKIIKREFQENKFKKTKYHLIPECKTVYASESDFKNPIMYFEGLWKEDEENTGIIKIIPPNSWQQNISTIFQKYYLPTFSKSDKKLETRIQSLNRLLSGKVK
jgi:hypothetical protein